MYEGYNSCIFVLEINLKCDGLKLVPFNRYGISTSINWLYLVCLFV